MSLHSSFKSGSVMKRHRSVLSRLERVKILGEREGGLNPLETSVLGLPKVKHLRIKLKKSKAEGSAEGEEAAAGAPIAGGAKAGAPPAKGGAAPKAGVAPKGGAAAPKGGAATPKGRTSGK